MIFRLITRTRRFRFIPTVLNNRYANIARRAVSPMKSSVREAIQYFGRLIRICVGRWADSCMARLLRHNVIDAAATRASNTGNKQW